MPRRRAHPGDLSDDRWQTITPIIHAARPGGRPRKAEGRQIFDAILYLPRAGFGGACLATSGLGGWFITTWAPGARDGLRARARPATGYGKGFGVAPAAVAPSLLWLSPPPWIGGSMAMRPTGSEGPTSPKSERRKASPR
jgi:transposase